MAWRVAFLFLLILSAATINLPPAFALQPPAAKRSNLRVALLIANSAYQDADAKLANPVRDARALGDELRGDGFEVTLRENLGKEDIQRALDAFLATIAPNSAALLYFSGFGIQVNRQDYLIPIDARIWAERNVQRDGIAVEKILGQMHAKGAKSILLIIDASRKNPFERRFRSYSAGLSAIDVPEGTLAISSASLDKVHEDTDSDPSLFMGELLKGMRVLSATAEQVFLRARNSVARASNGDRVPWVSSSLTEDFTFSQPPTAEASPPLAREADQVGPSASTVKTAPSSSTMPGETFRDCAECPEMVVIPAGEFDMGSNDIAVEKPIHRVVIGRPIAIGRREITFAEWDQCFAAGACKYRPDDRGWGRGDRPVIDVSWDDAKIFLAWLSQKTGRQYRLPTEAEWEYAARAGTASAYWWGRDAGSGLANCDGCGAPGGGSKTTPAGSFRPNGFGLYDTAGNAAEWVEDCWNDSYRGAPKEGGAWTAGQCGLRVLRGGSFGSKPALIRSAARFRYDQDVRYFANGFRAARDL